MKNTIIGLTRVLFCILMILFAEELFFSFLPVIGIDIDSVSYLVRELFVLGLYFIMLFIVYYLYKDHLKDDWNRYMRKWFPNILMTVVYFAIFTIGIWVISYITQTVAESLEITYIGLVYRNVFNQELNLSLIFFIIRTIIIMPLILCTVYTLGSYELTDSKKGSMLLSGFAGAVVAGLSLSGDLLFVFLNVIPYFAIYFGLSYIFHKNNHNTWFSIMTFILYSLLASLLIERFA